MKVFEFDEITGVLSLQRLFLYCYIYNRCTSEDNVLEIGCGDGKGLQAAGPPQIAEKVGEYLGIDKVRYDDPPFTFVQADIEEYGLSCFYDKIISLCVIQYVDPDKLFKLVSEHLSPGGTAYFSEGMVWQSGGDRLAPSGLCRKMREGLSVFNGFTLYGLNEGILVAEKDAKTGVFAVASNKNEGEI